MARGRKNPRYSSRINKLARLLVHGVVKDPREAVMLWERNKNKGAKDKDARLQKGFDYRTGVASPKGSRKFEIGKGSGATAYEYKVAKAEIADVFASMEGYKKPWVLKGKKGRKKSYSFSQRAAMSKRKRYVDWKRRSYSVKVAGYTKADGTKVKGYTKYVMSGKGKPSKQPKFSSARAKFRGSNSHMRERKWHADGVGWMAPTKVTWKKGQPKGPYKTSGYFLNQQAKANRARKNAGRKHAARMNRNSKGQFVSRNNPYSLGDLALTNPSFSFAGVLPYLTGYAAPVAVAGAAGGALHALAARQGWTDTLEENVAKIPGVGEFVADNLPYTLQGLIAGAVLGVAAPMVGGTAGKYLALTGGAALVAGGAKDAWDYITTMDDEGGDELVLADEEDDLEGLAFGALGLDNVSALGGLALDNVSALGGYGDLAYDNQGMTTADLEAPDPFGGDYDQTSYADAQYCGADFSAAEGQALINGRHQYLARFHNPPRRMAQHKVGASHLAGRHGHRWGWLIRTVGWRKAQAIAALPPHQRVSLIKKLRAASLRTFNQLMQQMKAESAEAIAPNAELRAVTSEPAAGTVLSSASAPGGPMGHSQPEYLGDPAIFMGA